MAVAACYDPDRARRVRKPQAEIGDAELLSDTPNTAAPSADLTFRQRQGPGPIDVMTRNRRRQGSGAQRPAPRGAIYQYRGDLRAV